MADEFPRCIGQWDVVLKQVLGEVFNSKYAGKLLACSMRISVEVDGVGISEGTIGFSLDIRIDVSLWKEHRLGSSW